MKEFGACRRVVVDTAMIAHAQEMLASKSVQLEKQARLFALLGNEVRLRIVLLLLYKERLCVCDLADILKMRQPPVSQHLRKLKDAGVLVNRRKGMTVYYRIANDYKQILQRCIGEDDASF